LQFIDTLTAKSHNQNTVKQQISELGFLVVLYADIDNVHGYIQE